MDTSISKTKEKKILQADLHPQILVFLSTPFLFTQRTIYFLAYFLTCIMLAVPPWICASHIPEGNSFNKKEGGVRA